MAFQAVCYLDEYNEMLDFIVRWSEKAKSLVRANIIWNSSVHLQEQIRMYQVSWRVFKVLLVSLKKQNLNGWTWLELD